MAGLLIFASPIAVSECHLEHIVRFIILLLLLAGGANAAYADERVTLIYSGNVDGELEPCGCSPEGDLGGVRRTATMLERLRAKQPALFTVSTGGLMSGFAAHGRLTNEYLLKGYTLLKLDAIGVQWADLSYGADLPARYPLPWVASNWRGSEFAKERRVSRGGVELAFFTWLDPASSPDKVMQGDHAEVNDGVQALGSALAEARRRGALTVLATALPLKEAEQRLPLKNVDVLLIRAKYEVYGEPQRRGHMLVLQPGSRGMRLGRVDLDLDGKRRIRSWRHEVINLPSSVADAPQLQTWYDDYTAEIKEAYAQMVALRKAQEQGETPFAGEGQCKACHGAQHEKWNQSRHARAFSSLEDVNKAFDPNCIQCHSVGFKQAGGYINLELTPQLSGVQCESCHGAARDHVLSAGVKRTANSGMAGPTMCAQCHTQPHSPSFNFEKYWPRIAH